MLGWELKDLNDAYKEALYGATRPFDYSSFNPYPLASNLQKDFLDRNGDSSLYYKYDNINFYNSAVFFDTVNHKAYATLLFDNGQSAIERYYSDNGTTFRHWAYSEANGTSFGGSEDCYVGASISKTLYSGSTYVYYNYVSSNISSVNSDLQVFTDLNEYYNYITNTYEENNWEDIVIIENQSLCSNKSAWESILVSSWLDTVSANYRRNWKSGITIHDARGLITTSSGSFFIAGSSYYGIRYNGQYSTSPNITIFIAGEEQTLGNSPGWLYTPNWGDPKPPAFYIFAGVNHVTQKGTLMMFNSYDTYSESSRYYPRSMQTGGGVTIANSSLMYELLTNLNNRIGWHSVESITGKLGTFDLTKIFEDYINDGEEVTNAEITNFDTGDDSIVSNLIKKAIGNDDVITVYYDIHDNDYQYIKLIYKKDDEPNNETDGTIIDISNEPTKCNISTITESGVYWFKIFTDKDYSEPYIFEFDYKNPIPPDLSYITKVNDMYFRRIDLYTCYMANQNVDSWFKDYTLVSGKIIMDAGGIHYDYHDAEHSVGSISYTYDPYVSFFSPKMTITVTTNSQGATVSYSSGDYYMPHSNYNNRYKMCIGNTNGNPPVDNKIYAMYAYEYGYDPYSFLQTSFESLADAIYYIYSHYSNINLYVNGEQWVEARS